MVVNIRENTGSVVLLSPCWGRRSCRGGEVRLTLLRKVRSVIFGRTIAGRIVVFVLSLHEQRTGWSSRHRASVEGRRAVYNNNTVQMTSRDWQPPQPLAKVCSHQQHAIFGKWLHHWGSTAAYGRRDFRRDFQFVVQNRDNEFVGAIPSLMSQLFIYHVIQNFKMVSTSKHLNTAYGRVVARKLEQIFYFKEGLISLPNSTNRGRSRCPGFNKDNLSCNWI